MSPLGFTVTHNDGSARVGRLDTPHGTIETPVFMPVGTQGTVKAVRQADLIDLDTSIILGNTYHLWLRPGDKLIAHLGGLHRFIGWSRPILTDSGGYQVFSLSQNRVVREEGVEFQSHIDGTSHLLTPEGAVEIQDRFGSDIAMTLDECCPYPVGHEIAASAMDRSFRWAQRARKKFLHSRELVSNQDSLKTLGQAQFGIIQGGVFEDLRKRSVHTTVELGFEGYAIGGLSVGEPIEVMYNVVSQTARLLPTNLPRYLMGVGTPENIVECVAHGIDMFDCVMPTRNARNGQLFTPYGRMNIKNAAYAKDNRPIDEDCSCYTCRHHTRAYLRHLFMAGEMTAGTLNTLHNLTFYLDTMRKIREAIASQAFEKFRLSFLNSMASLSP